MMRSFRQQPPPVVGTQPSTTGPQGSAPRLRARPGLAWREDDCLDDPNLRRIDAFLADDDCLDDASDEV